MNNIKLLTERFNRYTKEVIYEQKIDLVTEQCILFAEGKINEEELRSFLVEAHGEELAEAIMGKIKDKFHGLPRAIRNTVAGGTMALSALAGGAPDVQAQTPTSMTQQVGDLGAETADSGITSGVRDRASVSFKLMNVHESAFRTAIDGQAPTGLDEKDQAVYNSLHEKMSVQYQEWQADPKSEGGKLFEHSLHAALKQSIQITNPDTGALETLKMPENLEELASPVDAGIVGFINNYIKSK